MKQPYQLKTNYCDLNGYTDEAQLALRIYKCVIAKERPFASGHRSPPQWGVSPAHRHLTPSCGKVNRPQVERPAATRGQPGAKTRGYTLQVGSDPGRSQHG